MSGDTHAVSTVAGCHMVDLPRHVHANGALTPVQNGPGRILPFDVRRVFYLYDVPAESSRGGHSHVEAHELIVAVSGSFDVTIDDGRDRRTVTLNRPFCGLYIMPGIWRSIDNFSGGSVCLVLTSEEYDEADYVRDYDEFLRRTAVKKL